MSFFDNGENIRVGVSMCLSLLNLLCSVLLSLLSGFMSLCLICLVGVGEGGKGR